MTVQICDVRRLSPEGQEDLRRRVVAAIDAGMSQMEAARVFGVSRRAVGVWFRTHRTLGPDGLRANRRGRPPGTQHALPRRAQAELLLDMAAGPPEHLGLPGTLWSRRAVAELITERTGLHLSPTTVGHYLTRWGIAPAPAAGVPAGALPATHRRATDRARDDAQPLWLTWSRPVPKFVDADLLPAPGSFAAGPRPGCVGPPAAFLEALIAQSARGDLLFSLALAPYQPIDLLDFGQRLTRCVGHRVHLVVRSWPMEELSVLRAWAGDPGPHVRLSPA